MEPRFYYPSYLILSGWDTLIGHFPGHYCVLCFNGLEGKWLAEGLDTTSDAKSAPRHSHHCTASGGGHRLRYTDLGRILARRGEGVCDGFSQRECDE